MDRSSRVAASISLALLVGTAWALAGCGTPRRENSAKEWDRAQCNQIISEKERKRCLERVDAE